MLYAVTYEIKGISGPAGSLDTNRGEIIEFAKSMAEVALDQMGDDIFSYDWYDLEENEADPRKLLRSSDINQVANAISQVSEFMKTEQLGYIDFWEYGDIFQLIEEQEVRSWCSISLQNQIELVKKAYFALVRGISDEWAGS
jgi:hypothetical protein